MLTILLSTDWKASTDAVINQIAQDVRQEKGGRILIVPELVSHEMERRLCKTAGDTSSRFAEVLSFTRLSHRVCEYLQCSFMNCLDNGGRVVAMASAVRQIHSQLKAYAALQTRPEFLMGLVQAIDEFKRCCVTSADLKNASEQSQGSFAQKLEELSLILESYDSVCARGRKDPRDQMTWLLQMLEDSDFAKEHVFYFTGFPDFSRQNMQILHHIVENSGQVVISLNCDAPGSHLLAFEKAGQTARELIGYAKKNGIAYEIQHILSGENALNPYCEKLLQGSITECKPTDNLRVYRTQTVYEECVAAAEHVIDLVRAGCRYRDVRIVCPDVSNYQHCVNMVFRRAGIPLYQSGTEQILDKTVIHTVLSAMDAALSGFEQKDVIRYLKSMLSPLHADMCDKIENYAIMWSIDGKKWTSDWVNHPGGLDAQWTQNVSDQLQQLNLARKSAIDPLVSLRNAFLKAKDLSEQVQAVYQFLEEIHLSARLQQLAREMEANGDHRNAQILNQLWEILLNAMEQLYDMLGQTIWDAETFTRLFKLLLSQYDVGTIPSVLDAVTFGDVSAMRCHTSDHLILLGALEGSLPKYGGGSGVLTEAERQELQKMGIPLNSGAIDGLQTEFSEIYDVFLGSNKSVWVSCPSGQPSFIYDRLKAMTGEMTDNIPSLGAVLTDEKEAGAYLARFQAAKDAQSLGLTQVYQSVLESTNHQLGMIQFDNVKGLYGEKLHLSASQVDRLAECRLSYFLKYGMRARERKATKVDPAEFGTYVHAVLEACGRKIVQQGGFRNVSLEQTLQMAADISARYFSERFSQLDSQRLTYHFNRNSREVMLIVEELWKELQETEFQPTDFEVFFGPDGDIPAISISGQMMDADLRGFVDRVDTWSNDGNHYFRVVDYKTGAKDFDYCDVFNGIGLQMLLYLYALEDEGAFMLGDAPVSAGVQYFPARVPLISANGILSDEEAEEEREKSWKRKGLLLNEENVLRAIEPAEPPVRSPYSRRKDGSITGDLADRTQFKLLRRYIFALLSDMVDEIASGKVAPNPYTRGASHNACAFCPYGAICHAETVEGRRNFKAMKPERFWEEVTQEVNRRGR